MERTKVTARIKLKEMPQQDRYNKLKHESKMIMNIIKMIAYRAETAVANLLATFLSTKMADNEKRMLVKQIIQCHADIEPDLTNQTLTITLHTLSAPWFNDAASKLRKARSSEYDCCIIKKGFKRHSLETLYCLAPPARLERATL